MNTKIFSAECKFVAGAAKIDQIPNSQVAEFAFAGRSNVGKSSLINTLVHRNSLARVSKNPGCTRQINFFELAEFLQLVDLPGYGYANVSKVQSSSFNKLVLDYLRGRRQLKRIFLLIDSRHELKLSDEKMMDYLDDTANIYQVVLTKVDKISQELLEERIAQVKKVIEKHAACFAEIQITSSEKKLGIEAMRETILNLL